MVRTCVDSALSELAQLERDSSSSIPLRRQIRNLQLELRFFKMFFWCCANWDDTARDVLLESDVASIETTLRRAGRGLYAAGELAIRGSRTEKWDSMSSDLLRTIEELKSNIKRICLDLLDLRLECTYSTSQEILEFIDAILKNLKDFHNHKPKQQIRSLEEILGFLRNFVSVTERGIIMYEKFQDFWNHVQTSATNAACVMILYWIDDQMDELLKHRMINIKPSAPELRGMYLEVLKASEPAQSDPVMTSEVAASLVDFLLQYLPDSMNKYRSILGEGLMFLVSFLVQPSSKTIKGQKLFAEADEVLSNVPRFICFINQNDEVICELLGFLIKAEIIKAEVKELYVEISDISIFNFPKTNGLGFIDFLVENLKEMLETRKAFLKSFEKDKIAQIQKELLWLRCFLKDSIELKDKKLIENLWIQILQVAYKAEHVIDCLIHSSVWWSIICLSDVIQEIKNIKADAKKIGDEHKIGVRIAERNTSRIGPSPDELPTFNEASDAVGFDDKAEATMDLLMRGPEDLQIVSITGMPGVGKTTLANKVYNHQSVKLHFHKRAWCSCSLSGTDRSRELLLGILECLDNIDDLTRDMMKEDLADHIRKLLLGCRYLIVIDNIWGTAVWNELKDSFPNGDKGSRILFTSQTHDVTLGTQLPSCDYDLLPLSATESWKLFQAKLPLNGGCPPYFVKVAQQIVKNCGGLPLAIVTIAGLLSRKDKNFWKQIAENTSSFLDNKEGYKRILELSYNYLPDHLKPFFLYFGAFQEDKEIRVQKLIQLLVAEGFVPKMKTANAEDVAKQYLKGLIARSLVIVTNRGPSGEIKACRMHNLLRELCLAKVKQECFLKLLKTSQFSSNSEKHQQYRLCICSDQGFPLQMSEPSGPHVRSFLFSPSDDHLENHYFESFSFMGFKLLRVLKLDSIYFSGSFPNSILLLVHLRYLAVWGSISEVPALIEKLWNLETFLLKSSKHRTHLPDTIWDMKKLRHVNVSNISFSESEIAESAELGVETFGTLYVSYGQAKELLRRLPKVRKLKFILSEASYSFRDCDQIPGLDFPSNLECLNVLDRGQKLNLSAMKFPETLEKLTLSQCGIPWSKISIIGELPNLQILKLQDGAFVGETWDLDDNQFLKLKYLKLFRLDIESLNTSKSDYPFPNLEHLVVERCSWIVEIPYILGEISTLEKIEVHRCNRSAATSAGKLLEDFEHLEILLIDNEKSEDQ